MPFHLRLIRGALLALVGGLMIVESATAQVTAASRKVDEEAIRKAEAQYIEAAKKNDVRSLSAAWTADGDYINAAGVRTKARDLIGKATPSVDAADLLNDVKIKSSTLRLITSDVAIEDGVTEGSSDPETGSPPVRFTAVWVKQNGKWLLDSLRESPADEAVAQESVSAPRDLSNLEFLVGNWIGTLGTSTYVFSAKFNADKTVLVREFDVRDGERLTSEGTQYITLNLETGEVSSKSVDSSGTRAHCIWTRDADGTWHGESEVEMADGREVRSSNYYVPNPDGTWTWSVLDASVEGTPIPDLTIKFKRQEAP